MGSNSSRAEQVSGHQGVSIAVFGDAMIDYVVDIDSSAARDEKHAVRSSSRRLGGSGANAAAAITAICGPGSARLFATVSDDEWGRWIVTQMQSLGIDVGGVRRVPGSVPHAVVVHDADRRSLLVDRGVSDEVVMPPASELAAVDVVYVSNPVACLPRLEMPDSAVLVVGVEHQMVGQLTDAQLNRAALLITNAAGWEVLRDREVNVPCAETRGRLGVRLHQPPSSALDVAAVATGIVDPTGAGDAFAGAMCSLLARKVGLFEAVQRANRVASLAVGTPGSHLVGPVDSALVDRKASREVPHQP